MAERTLKEYRELKRKLQQKILEDGLHDLEFIGETSVGFLYKYEDLMISSKVVIHFPAYDPTEHFEEKRRFDEMVAEKEERMKKRGLV